MTLSKSKENPARTLEALAEFARRDQLEDVETYSAALEAVLAVFALEDGLIQLPDLPTIIIPDLHARRSLLVDTLSAQVNQGSFAGEQVFDLLQRGLINMVCVGDIMHSETRSDWVINNDGEWTQELLDKEMVRSLGAATMIMYLKAQYPKNFHCLRGNHDDMACELAKDFAKFVSLKYENDELVLIDGRPVRTSDRGEARIVKDWVLTKDGWGQPFLDHWSQFERSLPLLAQAAYYVISHTLPLAPLSEAEIRDRNRPYEVSLELTSRRGIDEAAINETLEGLGRKDSVKRWFYGHSQVSPETNSGKYEESLDGLAVRLNNPRQYVFAYVPASHDERLFDPGRDVYIKAPEEETFHW
jgi:hypothetical protein